MRFATNRRTPEAPTADDHPDTRTGPDRRSASSRSAPRSAAGVGVKGAMRRSEPWTPAGGRMMAPREDDDPHTSTRGTGNADRPTRSRWARDGAVI